MKLALPMSLGCYDFFVRFPKKFHTSEESVSHTYLGIFTELCSVIHRAMRDLMIRGWRQER